MSVAAAKAGVRAVTGRAWPGGIGSALRPIAEMILELTRDRPALGDEGVAVVLEDLHWADDATLAVARYLVDHASEVPAVVFATVRTGEGRDDVRAVLEASGPPSGRLVSTPGLPSTPSSSSWPKTARAPG